LSTEHGKSSFIGFTGPHAHKESAKVFTDRQSGEIQGCSCVEILNFGLNNIMKIQIGYTTLCHKGEKQQRIHNSVSWQDENIPL
jgi:hypothetical protein